MARRRPDRPLALRRPGIAAGHVGLHPTLVEKNQASRINRLDRRLIGDPFGGHIRALLLTRSHTFLFALQPPPFQRPTEGAWQRVGGDGVKISAADRVVPPESSFWNKHAYLNSA